MNQKWNPPTRYFVIGLALVFIVFVCWQIRAIFGPLVTAALIAYVFYPFVELLRRHFKIHQAAASRIVYFFSLALIIVVPVSLAPTLAHQIQTVSADVLKTLDKAELFLTQPIQVAGMQLHLESLIPDMKASLTSVLAPLPADALALLETTSVSALWFLVIVVSVYYFMTDWDKLRDWAISLAPANYQHDIWRLYRDIKKIWMSYLRSQLTLMTIVAVTFSIIWTIIGLPGALLLGLLAGLFSLIPDVGPFAATVLALVVAVLEGSNASWMPQDHFMFALIVAALYIVLINIKNIWLRPLIYGRSVNMHEGVVFVSIIVAVVYTGIVGAFIIVPALASLGIIGRYIHARILGIPAFDEEEPAPEAESSSSPHLDHEPAAPSPDQFPNRRATVRKKAAK